MLDTREGSAEDLALTPNGDLWVAMNVREPNASWRPRIALFDRFGNDMGVEMIGDDFCFDPGIGVCGKSGQGVPVGVGQPSMKIGGLTVGGTSL